MTRVAIDDQVSELPGDSSIKVGEMLQDVLSALPTNRIVTRILLDGKQLSTPASDPMLQDDISALKELQIRTVDREIWALNGLDIAVSCIERVQRSLIRAAEMFREETQSQANQFFVQCIDGLERFFEAVMITRCALKLDFNLISIDGRKLSQIESEFSGILRSIVECQERNDFAGVADRVEYELITNLCSWTKALNQLRLSQQSNA